MHDGKQIEPGQAGMLIGLLDGDVLADLAGAERAVGAQRPLAGQEDQPAALGMKVTKLAIGRRRLGQRQAEFGEPDVRRHGSRLLATASARPMSEMRGAEARQEGAQALVAGSAARISWRAVGADAAIGHEDDAARGVAGEGHLVGDHSMVMPSSARLRTTASTSPTSSGSSAEVISSSSRIFGSMATARAMPTRCCWPPESSAGRLSALSARPTRPSQCSATCARLGLGSCRRTLVQAEHDVARPRSDAETG